MDNEMSPPNGQYSDGELFFFTRLLVYSVIVSTAGPNQRNGTDLVCHNIFLNFLFFSQTKICSLEVFVQTASVGEFRKRLELLLAFHGQFSMRMHLKADPR